MKIRTALLPLTDFLIYRWALCGMNMLGHIGVTNNSFIIQDYMCNSIQISPIF